MADSCKPGKDADGKWAGVNLMRAEGPGQLSWEMLYGADGWCQKKDDPVHRYESMIRAVLPVQI